jgi:glycosyltransferase involved in cell wall biosynthesis
MFALGLGEVLATFIADRTVLVSNNTRRWFPWVKTVIPNGVDLDLFHPTDDGGKEPHPTIMFVGTYHRRKRGKFLMDMFDEQIRPAFPDAQLWMVCRDAPEAPGVEVLGLLDDRELADRYRRAWVFCLPSTYEGFGVPYIEALASGTPVVATPNVGACEILENGRFGIVTSDAGLADALEAMLGDESARNELQAVGVERARNFAWPRVVGAYEAIYRDLIANPPKGRRNS